MVQTIIYISFQILKIMHKLSKSFPAVTAFSGWNKFLVIVLRALFWIVQLFYVKKRAVPPLFFHDDPLHFTFSELIYFAYKYYLRPPIMDDDDGKTAHFFKNRPSIFSRKEFKVIQRITITAAGDLMPYEWIQKKYCTHLWDDIADDFFSSDIIFANLETPIDVSKPPVLVPEVMLNDMLFNADEEMFEIFMGIRYWALGVRLNQIPNTHSPIPILSTANNHALDMGEAGVSATINFLQEKEILHTGTSRTLEEKFNFPVVERNGIRIAFIAYTYSMNKFTNPTDKPWLVNHCEVNQPNVDMSPVCELVQHAREKRNADLVILSLHFSNAYQAYPCAHIIKNVKKIFFRCGPDLILGNHAHNIQPAARIDFVCPFTKKQKHGFVNFACGDFIAYDIFNWGHLTQYLKLHIVKGFNPDYEIETYLEKVDFVPVYVCGIYQDEDNRDLRLLDAERLSKQIKNNTAPNFLTPHHRKEFEALENFYERYILNESV